jgi:two-component system, OmpR family, KDP operon response regulator KdpE
MARVLVIDDDRALLRALTVGLSGRGHRVTSAATGSEGLTKVAVDAPEVVVLDLGLPDVDGIDVTRRIREWSEVPVIVLSATGLEDRKVAALDDGADDYVTKPFGMAELEARIRAAVRHRRPEPGDEQTEITVGVLTLDLVHHQASVDGRQVDLTAREFELLAFLARHAGKLCTHRMILDNVWGGRFGGEGQSLRVYIYRLRRKLDDHDGRLLRSSPGVGYSLSDE